MQLQGPTYHDCNDVEAKSNPFQYIAIAAASLGAEIMERV
jgi:hypothetical protein